MNDKCLAKLLKFHYISKQSFDFYGFKFSYTCFGVYYMCHAMFWGYGEQAWYDGVE